MRSDTLYYLEGPMTLPAWCMQAIMETCWLISQSRCTRTPRDNIQCMSGCLSREVDSLVDSRLPVEDSQTQHQEHFVTGQHTGFPAPPINRSVGLTARQCQDKTSELKTRKLALLRMLQCFTRHAAGFKLIQTMLGCIPLTACPGPAQWGSCWPRGCSFPAQTASMRSAWPVLAASSAALPGRAHTPAVACVTQQSRVELVRLRQLGGLQLLAQKPRKAAGRCTRNTSDTVT